jgi:hypothetical protein
LVTASKLKFHLTTKLANYILKRFSETPLEQFVHIQLTHYGAVKLDVETMHRWSKIIRAQAGTQSLIHLPIQEPIQEKLWQEPRVGVA